MTKRLFLTVGQRRFLNAMPNACPDCGGVTRCVCDCDCRWAAGQNGDHTEACREAREDAAEARPTAVDSSATNPAEGQSSSLGRSPGGHGSVGNL